MEAGRRPGSHEETEETGAAENRPRHEAAALRFSVRLRFPV